MDIVKVKWKATCDLSVEGCHMHCVWKCDSSFSVC